MSAAFRDVLACYLEGVQLLLYLCLQSRVKGHSPGKFLAERFASAFGSLSHLETGRALASDLRIL